MDDIFIIIGCVIIYLLVRIHDELVDIENKFNDWNDQQQGEL